MQVRGDPVERRYFPWCPPRLLQDRAYSENPQRVQGCPVHAQLQELVPRYGTDRHPPQSLAHRLASPPVSKATQASTELPWGDLALRRESVRVPGASIGDWVQAAVLPACRSLTVAKQRVLRPVLRTPVDDMGWQRLRLASLEPEHSSPDETTVSPLSEACLGLTNTLQC